MLVLLLGPSGVGKSTIAKILVEQHSWVPIISWLTRKEREDDLFKASISMRSYEMLSSLGKLWSDVKQGEGHYGLLTSEIQAAVADKAAFHVVDFDFRTRDEYFQAVPHLVIHIAAPDGTALKERLVSAGRPERAEGAERSRVEIEEWFAKSASDEVQRVENLQGQPGATAATVNEIALRWSNEMRDPA